MDLNLTRKPHPDAMAARDAESNRGCVRFLTTRRDPLTRVTTFHFVLAQSHLISARFSRMRGLHIALLQERKSGAKEGRVQLPPFPKKHVLRRHSPELLERRGHALAAYLAALLSDSVLSSSREVAQFLDASGAVGWHASPDSPACQRHCEGDALQASPPAEPPGATFVHQHVPSYTCIKPLCVWCGAWAAQYLAGALMLLLLAIGASMVARASIMISASCYFLGLVAGFSLGADLLPRPTDHVSIPMQRDSGGSYVQSDACVDDARTRACNSPLDEQLADGERAALAQLRALLPAAVNEYATCRFLRGSKGDVSRAATSFGECADWRAAQGLSELSSAALRAPLGDSDKGLEYAAEVEAWLASVYCPKLLDGHDLHGRPVVYVQLGNLDLSAASRHAVTLDMLLRRHVATLEKILRAVHASPAGPLKGHLLIHDLHGCTLTKFVRSRALFRALLQIDQKYYPELLGKLVCVRAPRLAVWAFEQVKPFIDPHTAAKIELHTGAKPHEALAAYLPVHRLPVELRNAASGTAVGVEVE